MKNQGQFKSGKTENVQARVRENTDN